MSTINRGERWSDRILWQSLGITNGYVIAGGALLVGIAIQISQFQFSSDVWVHLPAIAEFKENGLSPSHIFVSEFYPHHSLNVYHLYWGWLAWIFGWSTFTAAQIAGLVNAAALIIFFPQFVRTFVNHPRSPLIALVLSLLAWGPGAWRWSGFLNLNSIGFGIPYPSYFALWISFLIVWRLRAWCEGKSSTPTTAAAMAVGGVLVANSHVVTFGALLVLSTAVLVERRQRGALIQLGALTVGALVGAFAWPFMGLVESVSNGALLDSENAPMYQEVLIRTAPAWLGLVPLMQRFRRRKRDALAVAFLGFLIIYTAGFVFDRSVLGRALPFLVLSLHLALTHGLLELAETYSGRSRTWARAVAALLLVAGLALSASGLVRMVPRVLLPAEIASDARLQSELEWVMPVTSEFEYGDVVLAPPEISTQLASEGAKPVTFRLVPHVPNQIQRWSNATAFFNEPNPATVERYGVDWIVYRPDDVDDMNRSAIDMMGVPRSVAGFTLVELADE